MCPFCKDQTCKIVEKANGRVECECGKHAWPSAAVFAESCQRASLTITRMLHNWTQSY